MNLFMYYPEISESYPEYITQKQVATLRDFNAWYLARIGGMNI